jgi:hypothetical protein
MKVKNRSSANKKQIVVEVLQRLPKLIKWLAFGDNEK